MGSYYSGGTSYASSYGSSYGQQSYGGYHNSYTPPTQNVTIPPAPNYNTYTQLNPVYAQADNGYINNYYSQDYFIDRQVVVNDYYNVTPHLNSEYVYGGQHNTVSPLISTTSGCIPQFQPPQLSFSYGGCAPTSYPTCDYGCGTQNYGGGGYMQNTMVAPGGAYMTNQMWG